MYRLNDIVSAFLPLVGWEQSRNADKIDEAITTSESGLYFQEAHPMLTLRAMSGIMPADWAEGYPDWDSAKEYPAEAVVRYGGKAYMAIADNVGHEVTDTDYWKEYNILSDYLHDLSVRGIKEVVKRYVQDKVVGYETRNLVDRRCLFDGNGSIKSRVENKGRLVGFEITPRRKGGATIKLDKIGLQFVGNTGQITLYLFHSSKSDPVWSKTFDYTAKNGAMQWFSPDETFFSFLNEGVEGNWYLCYNQPDLPTYMESVNFQRDWSREPCGTCNKGDAALWAEINKWARISPFYIMDFSGKMWDVQDTMYSPQNNYGLNMQITIACDLTDTLIEHKAMFASAIQLQVATDALRTLALNPEVAVNRVQYNANRDNILFETDGNGQGIKGLRGELERAYKALSFDTANLDPYCLTCRNKGIRIGSI